MEAMHLRMSDVEYLHSLLKRDAGPEAIEDFFRALSARCQIELVAIILLGRRDFQTTADAIAHAESLAFEDRETSAVSMMLIEGGRTLLPAAIPQLIKDGYKLGTEKRFESGKA